MESMRYIIRITETPILWGSHVFFFFSLVQRVLKLSLGVE